MPTRRAGPALLALALVACGPRAEPVVAPAYGAAPGDEAPAAPASGIDSGAPPPQAVVTPFERDGATRIAAPTTPREEPGQFGVRPSVLSPGGAPPAALEVTDLIAGTGAAAQHGSNVDVHYVGIGWTSGCQFDASWGRGQPFTFALGQNRVIAGWEQGVAGMRVGGRRRLVIPPAMAYGPRGMGPCLQANETLIFVIDLLGVH